MLPAPSFPLAASAALGRRRLGSAERRQCTRPEPYAAVVSLWRMRGRRAGNRGLLGLPLSTLLSVKPVSFSDVWGDYFFMGLLSICLWLFSTRFDRSWQINRIEASILLSICVLFQIYVYQ